MSPLSLYIHVPFCSKRCPYCAFFKVTDLSFEETYVEALLSEMAHYSSLTQDKLITTVFFGGGTPNYISEQSLDRVMRGLKQYFNVSDDVEITMEMNPEHVTQSKLAVMVEHGLNRVSMGVQSFQQATLATLGREHTASHIPVAVQWIKDAGIARLNLDLIFGTPGTSKDDLSRDLDALLAMSPSHVSTYALTIEPGTAFAKQGIKGASDEESLMQYRWIRKRLMAAGYNHYEVSAFAKPGDVCRHNFAYWTLSDYIGLGPSGSSYWKGRYYKQVNDLTRYIQDPAAYVKKALSKPALPSDDIMKDAMVSGLRLRTGILLSAFENRFGKSVYEVFPDGIQWGLKEGWLRIRKGRLQATVKGMELLDSVLERFV